MNTTEQRLQALEREVRRSHRFNRLLLCAVVAAGCVAAARVGTPQASKPPTPAKRPAAEQRLADGPESRGPGRLRTIEADQFVLLDRQGRSRLKLAVTDAGPSIVMFDEQGRKRLELGQSRDTLGLRLLGADAASRVCLELRHDDGRARLEIQGPQGSSLMQTDGFAVRDAAGSRRAQLALLNGNFPLLGLSQSGQNGPPSIEMTATEGAPSLKLHDAQGAPLFWLGAAGDGSTSLNLRHPDHERSLQISAGPAATDGPVVSFFAPAGDDGTGGLLPLLRFGLHKDCRPYVHLLGRDGRTRFAAPSE